jgi:hypothetical protein
VLLPASPRSFGSAPLQDGSGPLMGALLSLALRRKGHPIYMKSVRDAHVSLVFDEGRFGVIIWLSPNATIRNESGNVVPGVLLTSDEARLLSRKILPLAPATSATTRRSDLKDRRTSSNSLHVPSTRRFTNILFLPVSINLRFAKARQKIQSAQSSGGKEEEARL